MFPLVTNKLFVKLSSISNYQHTRNCTVNFKLFGCRLNVRRNFIVHKGIVMWNHLPTELKLVASVHTFKKQLQLHISLSHD